MRQLLVRTLAVVGAFTVFFMLAVVVLLVVATSNRPTVPSHVILETELHRGLVERKDRSLLQSLGPPRPTVREMVEALESASNDPKVSALVSDLSDVSGGLAQ